MPAPRTGRDTRRRDTTRPLWTLHSEQELQDAATNGLLEARPSPAESSSTASPNRQLDATPSPNSARLCERLEGIAHPNQRAAQHQHNPLPAAARAGLGYLLVHVATSPRAPQMGGRKVLPLRRENPAGADQRGRRAAAGTAAGRGNRQPAHRRRRVGSWVRSSSWPSRSAPMKECAPAFDRRRRKRAARHDATDPPRRRPRAPGLRDLPVPRAHLRTT